VQARQEHRQGETEEPEAVSTRENEPGARVGPDVAAIQASEVCVP